MIDALKANVKSIFIFLWFQVSNLGYQRSGREFKKNELLRILLFEIRITEVLVITISNVNILRILVIPKFGYSKFTT